MTLLRILPKGLTLNRNLFSPQKKTGAIEPVWKGPYVDGITFSLLTRFLCCRHRFYLQSILGYIEDEGFNSAIEFGSMFHAADESYATGLNPSAAIRKYASYLHKKYPNDRAEILTWESLCEMLFPVYRDFWKGHPDERRRKYFMAERAFRISYGLPSGRTIIMRGKIDAGFTEQRSVYIKETKTKGYIDAQGIAQTVPSNLQTLIYFICSNYVKQIPSPTGVLYNVIRRPLSAKDSPRQKKQEKLSVFHGRVIAKIAAAPKEHFYRWKVSITPAHVARFKKTVLHPILEQLCDWWDYVSDDSFSDPLDRPWTSRSHLHWQAPWGVYNSLANGFRGDYFDYLSTGSQIGLTRTKQLYPELEPSH